jgi:hypothetical protein
MNDANRANGVITWRIIGVAGWIALSAVLLFWMEDVSNRLDKVSIEVASLKGWIQAHDKIADP